MSANLEKVLTLVDELSEAERGELRRRLDAFADEAEPPSEEWEELWAAEAERRMADLEAGRTKLVSWEEIKANWAGRR